MAKTCTVRFSQEALTDLWASFEWGVDAWGLERALDGMDDLIRARLAIMPLSHPIAPETFELNIEIRHLVIGRYRVLFTVIGREVLLVRVRGPFTREGFEFE
jgi:plasmid stabilization system protein ParE